VWRKGSVYRDKSEGGNVSGVTAWFEPIRTAFLLFQLGVNFRQP